MTTFRGAILALAIGVLGAAPTMTLAGERPAQTQTRDTRAGEHPNLTRLVLDVSELTRFYTHVADDGLRILVGIPSVDWEANRHRLKPFGLIARFDFMRRGLKRGLLVIHAKAPSRIEHQFTLGPDLAEHRGNRLVLDLVPRDLAGKVPMPAKSPASKG